MSNRETPAIVTVKDLIEMLSAMDPDAVVCTDYGCNPSRCTGDFRQIEAEDVFDSDDYENYSEGGKLYKDDDGDTHRKVVVIRYGN